MALIQCPECGQNISDKAKHCIHCGYSLQEPVDEFTHKWRCANCGELTNLPICSHCGKSSTEKQFKVNIPQYAISDVVFSDSHMEQTPITPITNNKDSKGQVQIQDNKAKVLRAVLGMIAVVIVLAITLWPNEDSGSSGRNSENSGNIGDRLDGTYMAQTDFGLNGIYFMEDGHFARYSNITFEYGDWSLVAEGTYSLESSTLTLYCSDGRIHQFYYDRENDTMVQNGFDDIFYRQID